jgi:hypothetical protein
MQNMLLPDAKSKDPAITKRVAAATNVERNCLEPRLPRFRWYPEDRAYGAPYSTVGEHVEMGGGSGILLYEMSKGNSGGNIE